MQKCLLFLMAYLFLATPGQAQPHWSPYYMNRERFVHLAPEQQEKVLIKTMEFMVELEAKYELQVATSGYSEARYRKFVQLYNQLQNFIFSSAYAQANGQSIPQLADKFSILSTKLKDELCIYGGYLSRTVTFKEPGKAARPICASPMLLGQHYNDEKDRQRYRAIDAEIKAAYAKPKSEKDCDPKLKKMTCNPIIFGYKKFDTSEPFCVDTDVAQKIKDDKSQTHNVSHDCMQQALSLTVKADTDDKDTRLAKLRDAMNAQGTINNVQTYVFKACVCNSDDNLNKKYKTYMRPHRTCYGMMNTLREVNAPSCDLDTAKPTENAEAWLKFFGETPKNFGDPRRSSQDDKDYYKLIDTTVAKKLCGELPPDEPVVTPPTTKQTPPVVPAGPEKKKDEYACGTTVCRPSADGDDKPKVTCDPIALTKNGEAFTDFDKAYELTDNDTKVNFKRGKEVLVTCPVVAKGAGCSIAVDDQGKTATLTLSLGDVKVEKDPEIKWTGGGKVDAKDPKIIVVDKTEKEQKITASFEIPNGEKIKTCEAQVPMLDPEKGEEVDYGLTVEITKTEEKSVDLKATVTKGDKEAEKDSVRISWSRSGDGVELIKEKKEDKEKKPKDEGTVKDEEEPEKEAVSIKGEIDTGPTFRAPRVAKDYEVCASLYDLAGKPIKNLKGCKTIPKLKAAPAPVTPATNPQGQPGLMLPTVNLRYDGKT